MKTSIATVSLSGTLMEKLEAAAGAGFDAIEIFDQDLVSSELHPAEIRRRATDLGLEIAMLQPLRDVEGTDPETFRRSLHRAGRKFDVAYELGAPLVLLCANVATATIDDDGVVIEQLRTVGELAADMGVRVAYEALAWSTFVNDYRRAWRLAAAANHPSVGVCLDSFHILSRATPLAEIGSLPADRLFFVQLADAPRLSMDLLTWSRHFRVFPGQGDWDLVDFTDRVLRAGYEGPISIEVFNDVFRQTDPAATALSARQSLLALEDGVARHLASRGYRTAAPVRKLPSPDTPLGFDFVEIVDSEDSGISAMLDGIGLVSRGRHQRKSEIELWAAGDARIIVNHEPNPGDVRLSGFGVHSHHPQAAGERAAALLAPEVSRDSGPGEAALFASRAPDGIEIFWSDATLEGRRTWDREFGGDRDVERSDLSIDHIAVTQPWPIYDEAVLFYRSVLDLQPGSSVDVADPYGLVRSQTLAEPDGRVRVVLNVLPQRARDRTSAHIALRCGDVLGIADRLASRGVGTLEVPDNYYVDLAARFTLPASTIEALRARNVFYDRDGDGEFLQLYLPSVGDLFIELVERRHGYDGYGAANAPIRRAAQRRWSTTGGRRQAR
jgi:4-hydroxyphenylpyruvate dioxygenase